jgi:hypothetical protein
MLPGVYVISVVYHHICYLHLDFGYIYIYVCWYLSYDPVQLYEKAIAFMATAVHT